MFYALTFRPPLLPCSPLGLDADEVGDDDDDDDDDEDDKDTDEEEEGVCPI